MEAFKTKNQANLLLLKVAVDTTESAFTNVYENINNQRVKPPLVNSEAYENGTIDLDVGNTIRWKEIGKVFYFKGKKLEILTFILHLPADLSDNDYPNYIIQNVRINYYLKEGNSTKEYSMTTAKIEKFAKRTAMITQTIEIS